MFNPLDETLDIDWLLSNGWTIPGNLAYRHILRERRQCRLEGRSMGTERIEQIIMQYDCLDQTPKIVEALKELIEIKKAFSHFQG
jgi:hypothetical protein